MNQKPGLLVFFFAVVSNIAFSQDAGLRARQFNLAGGLAIDGYDPVAYFKGGKAVKGKKDFGVSYRGVTYYFSSADGMVR